MPGSARRRRSPAGRKGAGTSASFHSPFGAKIAQPGHQLVQRRRVARIEPQLLREKRHLLENVSGATVLRTARVLTMGSGRKAKSPDSGSCGQSSSGSTILASQPAADTYLPQHYRIPEPQDFLSRVAPPPADQLAQEIGVVVLCGAIEGPGRQFDIVEIVAGLGEDADAVVVVLREAIEVVGEKRPPGIGPGLRSDRGRRLRRGGEASHQA